MTPNRHRRSEEGSLLLALLAVLIIGAIVSLVLASTVTGQRQVQFDRNFSNVIHGADSGIEAAITYINTQEASDTSRPNTGDVLTDTGDVPGGYAFTWEAKKVNDAKWEIFAYGEAPDGTVRLLEAEVIPQPLFQFAAFAKTKVGLGGGNTADSYDPDPDANTTGRDVDGAVDTGRGIVGSNGVISIDNNSTANNVDGAELHDFTDDPGTSEDEDDLNYRIQGTCSNCGEFRVLVEDGGKLFGVFEEPLRFDMWWITRTLAYMEDRNPSSPYNDSTVWNEPDDPAPEKCNAYFARNPQMGFDPGTLPDQLQFDDGEVRAVQGRVTYTWTTSPGGDVPPGVWCAGASGVIFDGATNSNIDLQGADGNSDPDPALIYTSGDVRIGSQININCEEPGYRCSDEHPFSTNVQIYSTGSEFFIGNQAKIAAVIYAPNAQCTSPTSNASADIYGSVVCDNMTNVGGWAFHFDENSRRIKKQEYQLDTWREEPGGTTFDWVTISPR